MRSVLAKAVFACSLPCGVLGKLVPVPEIFRRQAPPVPDNTSIPENTFASIVPSVELEWFECYSDRVAAQLGTVECARLLVSHFLYHGRPVQKGKKRTRALADISLPLVGPVGLYRPVKWRQRDLGHGKTESQ